MDQDDWNEKAVGSFGHVSGRLLVSTGNSTWKQEFVSVPGAGNIAEFVDGILDSPMELTIETTVVYRGTMRSLVLKRLIDAGLLLMKPGQEG